MTKQQTAHNNLGTTEMIMPQAIDETQAKTQGKSSLQRSPEEELKFNAWAKEAESKMKGSQSRQNDNIRIGNFIVMPSGLYFYPKDLEEKDLTEGKDSKIWISSPIWPEAHLRDKDGKGHSILVKVHDGEREHRLALPFRLVAKLGDLNDILLDLGQEIPLYPKNQKLLQEFLLKSKPEKKMRCVYKAGWHGSQYIFPDGHVIGKSEVDIENVYPLNEACPKGIEQKGSLGEWQENVLHLCVGNSRMILSIGVAFASMCLQLVGEESGAFNLIGPSSKGKTKCLKAGISVIGSEEYKRSWKATANGLEGICALHNDSMLPLDEFGQADANEVGEIAYMVSAGIGKQRAGRDGSPREPKTWRVFLLSTGEIGLEDHMREGKNEVKAGQLVRIVDVPAIVGEHGCFEKLHGYKDGKEFADAIDEACKKAFGSAAREFIQRITEKGIEQTRCELKYAIDDFVYDNAKDCDGQVKRVAQRFGLVFAALILSKNIGIFGEKLDRAMIEEAITKCYKAWLDKRGTGGDFESHKLIEHVKGVLNENAEGKFAPWSKDPTDKTTKQSLWGYRQKSEFYVLPKAFEEQLCKNRDKSECIKILKNSGLLIPGNSGNRQSARIPSHHKKPDNFYVINLSEIDVES